MYPFQCLLPQKSCLAPLKREDSKASAKQQEALNLSKLGPELSDNTAEEGLNQQPSEQESQALSNASKIRPYKVSAQCKAESFDNSQATRQSTSFCQTSPLKRAQPIRPSMFQPPQIQQAQQIRDHQNSQVFMRHPASPFKQVSPLSKIDGHYMKYSENNTFRINPFVDYQQQYQPHPFYQGYQGDAYAYMIPYHPSNVSPLMAKKNFYRQTLKNCGDGAPASTSSSKKSSFSPMLKCQSCIRQNSFITLLVGQIEEYKKVTNMLVMNLNDSVKTEIKMYNSIVKKEASNHCSPERHDAPSQLSSEDSIPQPEQQPITVRTPSFTHERQRYQRLSLSQQMTNVGSQLCKDLFSKQMILEECKGIVERLRYMENDYKFLIEECSKASTARAEISPVKKVAVFQQLNESLPQEGRGSFFQGDHLSKSMFAQPNTLQQIRKQPESLLSRAHRQLQATKQEEMKQISLSLTQLHCEETLQNNVFVSSSSSNQSSSSSSSQTNTDSEEQDQDMMKAEEFEEEEEDLIVEDEDSSYGKEEETKPQLNKISLSSKPIMKKKRTSTRKRNRAARPRISSLQSSDIFQCSKCGEVFNSGWALGGHASRVHPGESDAYRKKIERREQRAFERWLLNLAKQRHLAAYGQTAPINRVKIRKFKRQLRNEVEQGFLIPPVPAPVKF
ncbi:hypothetical protein FGO68_gene8686 [Halteria grandinella]|uniref:C2H2-type domain-containing protein n=1 Tax=Halteria grandinella TaxID=5974 RepID=A0A8J8T4U5_HALGN|nr:hypothetical protein FGO68_gene8686 [Halteria grandinella]